MGRGNGLLKKQVIEIGGIGLSIDELLCEKYDIVVCPLCGGDVEKLYYIDGDVVCCDGCSAAHLIDCFDADDLKKYVESLKLKNGIHDERMRWQDVVCLYASYDIIRKIEYSLPFEPDFIEETLREYVAENFSHFVDWLIAEKKIIAETVV
jgi:hypothetical protein